ncbi:MAG: c-type cytochrome biogenesis protein CcmI [Desulfobulbus sp.]|nr:c-type cytochrome biogenesis protein CcmI [Desulfobulbus sp.]
MMPFILYATLIVVVICAFLFLPLWLGQRGAAAGGDRQAANLAIFRDQLAELERERQEGTLAAADFDQARQELQRRLLDEASPAADVAAAKMAPSRKTALALLVLLPLAAAGGYALLGNPAALDPMQRSQPTQHDIERMVSDFAAKMEKEPDNLQGWVTLGRSYKVMGRGEEAERAYQKAWPLVEHEPQLLTEYADLLASKAGSLSGRPEELVNQALALDPDNLMALWLSGTAAFNRGDYATAVERWQRAQQHIAPDSEDSQMLASSIEEAQRKLGGGKVAAAAAKASANASASIRGHVELAAALKDKAAPGDTVFIAVKEAGGPPMPLAAGRLTVADLPTDFSFSDADAMMPSRLLSSVKTLQIDVRVSRSGTATPQPGDLAGSSGPVKFGAGNLRIVIDKALP